MIEIIKEIY